MSIFLAASLSLPLSIKYISLSLILNNPTFEDAQNLVYHENLSLETWEIFRDIHDKAFVPIPNGGRLDSDSYEGYMTTVDDTTSNLIYYYNNVPIDISIFAKDDSEIKAPLNSTIQIAKGS